MELVALAVATVSLVISGLLAIQFRAVQAQSASALQPSADELGALPVGTPLPRVQGRDVMGRPWSTSEVRGPALVSVLSGSCTACVDAARDLAKWAKEDDSVSRVVLYGEPEAETRHVDEVLGDAASVIRCDRGALVDILQVHALPLHYVVDDQGVIVDVSVFTQHARAGFDAAAS